MGDRWGFFGVLFVVLGCHFFVARGSGFFVCLWGPHRAREGAAVSIFGKQLAPQPLQNLGPVGGGGAWLQLRGGEGLPASGAVAPTGAHQ